MTLLITIFAAVITTVVWYNRKDDTMNLSPLLFMYWGASLMWMVDAIFEFVELKAEYFNPSASEMLNDTFLGLSAVAFGLVVWVVILLIKDPKGVVAASLQKQMKQQ